MTFSSELLLSDLLHRNARCDHGLDHGPGVMAWMHPPIHRLLGWSTRPSTLRLIRDVWRLDQLKGISSQEVFVKGNPAESDQATLNRFPTLLEADLINKEGEKIGLIADFVFNVKTGDILYYLVSRSNPKLPGTSRWRLSIENIQDQQPGIVLINSLSLDNLPIIKSSIRHDLIRKSQKFRDQFQEISLRANSRLEGWLEDFPWEKSENDSIDNHNIDFLDEWEDTLNQDSSYFQNESKTRFPVKNNGDPWI